MAWSSGFTSLKASLMARCTAEDWKYQLPWVLLGLRTSPKANGAPSAAEKTYGEPLVVPGELVTEDHRNPSVQRLRDIVGKFAPCKRTYTDRSATFTPPGLSSTTNVFVRDDAIRPTLTRPYSGPFRVLERNNKAFLLALHGKNDWVSVDRVKPALLEEDTDVTTPHPPPGQPSPQLAPYFLTEMNRLRMNPDLEHRKVHARRKNIEEVQRLVMQDHQISVRMLSEAVGISIGTVETVLTEEE
ncbi:uncharacterized protein [Macrobrachium rosenbergii]|uniref:uncharacterized protein n=1 Tax=Macrobrachium rosenbergii TaxID=79674 RepID=UPI0034D62560